MSVACSLPEKLYRKEKDRAGECTDFLFNLEDTKLTFWQENIIMTRAAHTLWG